MNMLLQSVISVVNTPKERSRGFKASQSAAAVTVVVCEWVASAINEKLEREKEQNLLNKPQVIKSAFKCDDIELQPIECEKWRGCFDCPHYKVVL